MHRYTWVRSNVADQSFHCNVAAEIFFLSYSQDGHAFKGDGSCFCFLRMGSGPFRIVVCAIASAPPGMCFFRFPYTDRTARQDLWANCVTLFTSQKFSLLSPRQKRWNYCFLMPEQNFEPTHRWFDLCYRSHIRINEAVSMCNELIDAYNEPHRHYHTMNHVD